MFTAIYNSYKASFSGLSRESWLLSIVIFINRCGYMALPFMSLYVTQSLHRNTSDAGWILALFGVGSVAGGAMGGYFTDKIGYRQVQILMSLTSGSLFLLFATICYSTRL